MKGMTIVVVALAGAIVSAAPANADDPPAAGASCQAAELDNIATASDGKALRCLANDEGGFTWMADTGAAGTIGQLENEGYTVNIDRVGNAPLEQCKVTDVRNPVTVTRTNRTGTGAGGGSLETIIVSKTISVSLDCTG